jgi:glutathione S-transferase
VQGEDELSRDERRAHVQQVALTALDLMVEAHETHHPIANVLYCACHYNFPVLLHPNELFEDEEQKDEAKRRTDDFRTTRVPKFYTYFESVLESNPSNSGYLIDRPLTTADLALYQVCNFTPRK